MPASGFEPAIPAQELPLTHTLDREATGNSRSTAINMQIAMWDSFSVDSYMMWEFTRYLGSSVSVLNSFIPSINCIGLVKVFNMATVRAKHLSIGITSNNSFIAEG